MSEKIKSFLNLEFTKKSKPRKVFNFFTLPTKTTKEI